MQLSTRLETICRLAGSGDTVCDIGTDHGYVPIELVRRGQFKQALAMDVRKGPLLRAGEHICEAGLMDRITVRLSNGFERMEPGEAEVVVIAGMGGPLMTELLEQGKMKAQSAKHLILSPQSEVGEFHRYLIDNHYKVDDELWIEDENKFYVVIRTACGDEETWTEEELCYGRIPLREKSEVLAQLLEKEIETADQVLKHLEGREGSSAEGSRIELLRRRTIAVNARRIMQEV